MNTSKRKQKTIIYVNFAPYENTGKILDFILSRFHRVILFSFNFHRLSGNRQKSVIKEYSNGKLHNTRFLYYLPTPKSIAFLILPIRSVIIFLQIILYLFVINKKYGTPDIYFTVNAFTAWCGIIGKKLGLVKKTIFWVWDYYPPIHADKIVMFMRWLYWQFDKPASRKADRVVFLNTRLEQLRKNIGILPLHASYPIVEIGTDPTANPSKKPLTPLALVFFGVLKKSQGLDLFFDAALIIAKKYPGAVLHIIGGGPDEHYFRKRISQCPVRVVFHGYIPNDNVINQIIKKCHIGIAPYIPDKGNVAYYGDPSKIKRYLSLGLPVITTNVFHFSKTIEDEQAGLVIPYGVNDFIKATNGIMNDYRSYQRKSLTLAKRYYYKKIYPILFDDTTG